MRRLKISRRFVLWLYGSWAILATLALSGGQAFLLTVHRPLEWMIEWVLPDFAVRLAPASLKSDGDIQVLLHAVKVVPITATHNIRPWVDITLQFYSGHSLSPLVLLLGVLCAWPLRETQSRWKILAAGLVLALAILALAIPIHVAGLLEYRLQLVANHYREARAEPWYLTLMVFLELGGLWLIPMLVAAVLLLRHSWVRAAST